MKLLDVADLAPVQRLLAVAQGDTGQYRTVADFLLAWWNAQACGGFDLAALWSVDDAIVHDMLATAALVARHGEYPTASNSGRLSRISLSNGGPHSSEPKTMADIHSACCLGT